jgi:glucose/arabinose dehydrogenase
MRGLEAKKEMESDSRKAIFSSFSLLTLLALLLMTGYRTASSNDTAPPFSDYRTQAPGAWHKITVADLPPPYATPSVDSGQGTVKRPQGAWPKAPADFKVELYDASLKEPREVRVAPNGDLFIAESMRGDIVVLRGISKDGKAQSKEVFARGLELPFGIAFYPPGPEPQWVYVANTGSVVRFPYSNGDMKARGPQEMIVKDVPSGGHLRGGGHWTRDLAISRDGKKMFVSVGSQSNVDDPDTNKHEFHRADILEFNPDGGDERVFAYGIRNAVGIETNPQTGELWCSVNERDGLGDNLPPDYITHVQDGGFYGWPWYYMGGIQDPRHRGKHPELKDKTILPDVLLQPHNASLEMTFYEGRQFPAEYHGDIFAGEHGSWNRAVRTGYEVIRVPLHGHGKATGEYEDFLTGFVTPEGNVWGRPVGVAVGSDGSLFVTDDESNTVWRVVYVGK